MRISTCGSLLAEAGEGGELRRQGLLGDLLRLLLEGLPAWSLGGCRPPPGTPRDGPAGKYFFLHFYVFRPGPVGGHGRSGALGLLGYVEALEEGLVVPGAAGAQHLVLPGGGGNRGAWEHGSMGAWKYGSTAELENANLWQARLAGSKTLPSLQPFLLAFPSIHR